MPESSHSVYPGEYTALTNEEDMIKRLKGSKKKVIIHPDLKIAELPDCYRIDMIMPGVNREEILINTKNNKLSIFATHAVQALRGGYFDASQLKCEGFRCNLRLPQNADPEFASAEYKEGILHMHFHKSDRPRKSKFTKIIVY